MPPSLLKLGTKTLTNKQILHTPTVQLTKHFLFLIVSYRQAFEHLDLGELDK